MLEASGALRRLVRLRSRGSSARSAVRAGGLALGVVFAALGPRIARADGTYTILAEISENDLVVARPVLALEAGEIGRVETVDAQGEALVYEVSVVRHASQSLELRVELSLGGQVYRPRLAVAPDGEGRVQLGGVELSVRVTQAS